MIGYPISSPNARASSTVLTVLEGGTGSPNFLHNSLNFSLSSACSIEESFVPSNSIFNSSKIPVLAKASAMFNPTWPPRVGRIASGYSCLIILEIDSTVSGSM